MIKKALDFLRNHNEVAFATSDGHLPKLRMFQIMKQENNVLFFFYFGRKSRLEGTEAEPQCGSVGLCRQHIRTLFRHGELRRRGGCEAMDLRS